MYRNPESGKKNVVKAWQGGGKKCKETKQGSKSTKGFVLKRVPERMRTKSGKIGQQEAVGEGKEKYATRGEDNLAARVGIFRWGAALSTEK